jgi:hypothetical protein
MVNSKPVYIFHPCGELRSMLDQSEVVWNVALLDLSDDLYPRGDKPMTRSRILEAGAAIPFFAA